MRRKDTIKFLGLWESLNNMNFNSVEFDRIKSEAGYNSFTLSPKKWVEKTGAIGIISKGGRYSGAFAHTNIAFEFALWISAEFKMLIDLYKEKSLVKHLMEVQKRNESRIQGNDFSLERNGNQGNSGSLEKIIEKTNEGAENASFFYSKEDPYNLRVIFQRILNRETS